MPLTAYHAATGELVESFLASRDEWAKMKAEGKGAYLMRRTGIPAFLKQNMRGTRWFAHPPGQKDPNWGPESAEHIIAKVEIIKALREAGYDAKVEEPGETPEGEKWEADVLCTVGERKIAFEVQLSKQAFPDYEERTERYRRSGVKAVWIVNFSHFRAFTLDCLYSLGWTGMGPLPESWHLPHIPVFPMDLRRFKRGEPQVELMHITVWPDNEKEHYRQLSVGQFACGVAAGALYFSKGRQKWCWRSGYMQSEENVLNPAKGYPG
jgi:hypothetical protein